MRDTPRPNWGILIVVSSWANEYSHITLFGTWYVGQEEPNVLCWYFSFHEPHCWQQSGAPIVWQETRLEIGRRTEVGSLTQIVLIWSSFAVSLLDNKLLASTRELADRGGPADADSGDPLSPSHVYVIGNCSAELSPLLCRSECGKYIWIFPRRMVIIMTFVRINFLMQIYSDICSCQIFGYE